jgi:hypothetical protein
MVIAVLNLGDLGTLLPVVVIYTIKVSNDNLIALRILVS